MSTTEEASGTLGPQEHRAAAVEAFNLVWALMERDGRSAEDDDRMVHAAHASRFHWGEVGGEQQQAIGEWQCSRAYAVLGRAEPALYHARRALELARLPDQPGWLPASAMEGMARASAVDGDIDAARTWADDARTALESVEDAEDREVVLGDLATLPIQTG